MLKTIFSLISDDESRQDQLEKRLSERMVALKKRNLLAFKHTIPSVLQQLQSRSQSPISVFCTAAGETNIVDYSSGIALYGMEPKEEAILQAETFALQPQKTAINLQDINPQSSESSLPDTIPVLVVFGVGLGFHIEWLLSNFMIKNLIIYEQELEYFACSLNTVDWSKILRDAKTQKTSIFFQLSKDGSSLLKDIEELSTVTDFKEFYYYQHYNTRSNESIVTALRTVPWQELSKKGFSAVAEQVNRKFITPWTPYNLCQSHYDKDSENTRFRNNLAAFKRYFPDIAKEFESYTPSDYAPAVSQSGVNLFDRLKLTTLYSHDPRSDNAMIVDAFTKHPNRNGLILGYNGKKLREYLHYQFVKATDSVLDSLEDAKGELPETIHSIITFGIGIGYSLEQLFLNHKIDKLFICEPNKDFFYSSLFAIDWEYILQTIDDREGRIYINIGDDGTHLFNDLLSQFSAVGPDLLVNTFFFQGYYDESLTKAIQQLREQLKVIVAMGDYYDHARFGIAHTSEGIRRNLPFLRTEASKVLSLVEREVPVFIVGNGPSLDSSISAIKEVNDQVIVVSCGSALMALHRANIVPDFHAEIEQNRATYDWAARIGDFDYLKQISLLSCNGIHPDTVSLYKDCYLAFKDGEASTTSCLNVLGTKPFARLVLAFPTVANFAVNLFTSMSFSQIYLFGVDLGFTDTKRHHSMASGYYNDDGSELYDYAEENSASILARGNFGKPVVTKYEFKVAKTILQQCIKGYPGDIYNVSDGVFIEGAMPLVAENIFISNTIENSKKCLLSIKERCFLHVETSNYFENFNLLYDKQCLSNELEKLSVMSNESISSETDAMNFIKENKQLMYDSVMSRRSLFFHYFHGTLNYLNSVLSKIIYCSNEAQTLALFHEVMKSWTTYLEVMSLGLIKDANAFDAISNFPGLRRKILVKKHLSESNLIVEGDPSLQLGFEQALSYIGPCSEYSSFQDRKQTIVLTTKSTDELSDKSCQYDLLIQIVRDESQFESAIEDETPRVVVYLPGCILNPNDSPTCQDIQRVYIGLSGFTKAHQTLFVLPKLVVSSSSEINRYYDMAWCNQFYAYAGEPYIVLCKEPLDNSDMLLADGTRLSRLVKVIEPARFVFATKTSEEIAEIKQRNLEIYPL